MEDKDYSGCYNVSEGNNQIHLLYPHASKESKAVEILNCVEGFNDYNNYDKCLAF